MKKVFSFSLFGEKEKYWKGLLININLIRKYFPQWEVYVWYGGGSPPFVLDILDCIPFVKVLQTNQSGLINMSYRFFSIDDPEVEIMCVRDADSRIYERDRACIEDFVNSDKLFHIIRDHPNHHHPIMGGMWGIKKGVLGMKLETIFEVWAKENNSTEFWNDMDFLRNFFYPHILPHSIIHDEIQQFEPSNWKTPFRVALDSEKNHFIGQVYEFDSTGQEYPVCKYREG